MPAFNAADTIGEALESALTQFPPPYEVVVSDDGSRDNLAKALKPYGRHVLLVHGPQAGLATARNRAATVARGELFALLDADDVWLPGRVDALTDAATVRADLAVLTTDAVIVRDGTPDARTYYATREFYVEDQEKGILRNSFIFGAGAIRAEVFRAVGGYRSGARFAEDWDLWLRLLLSGHRAGLIDQPLYEYRRRKNSLTAQKLELAYGVLDVLADARSHVRGREQRRQLERTQQYWRESAARAARRINDPRARGIALHAAVGRRATPRARLRFGAAAVVSPRTLAAWAGAW